MSLSGFTSNLTLSLPSLFSLSKWSANRSTETDPQGAPKVDGLTYILRKTLRAAA